MRSTWPGVNRPTMSILASEPNRALKRRFREIGWEKQRAFHWMYQIWSESEFSEWETKREKLKLRLYQSPRRNQKPRGPNKKNTGIYKIRRRRPRRQLALQLRGRRWQLLQIVGHRVWIGGRRVLLPRFSLMRWAWLGRARAWRRRRVCGQDRVPRLHKMLHCEHES